MDRILWTAADGSLAITHPNEKIMRAFQLGGVGRSEPDAPVLDVGDLIAERGIDKFTSRQLDRWIEDGVSESAAHRYTNALLTGGCTESEAYAIIRDKDLFLGRDHIRAEAPTMDRFFRDAWRLTGNTITIDLVKAKSIFAIKLVKERAARHKMLTEEIDIALIEGMPSDQLEAALTAIQAIKPGELTNQVLRASTAEELRALWPF